MDRVQSLLVVRGPSHVLHSLQRGAFPPLLIPSQQGSAGMPYATMAAGHQQAKPQETNGQHGAELVWFLGVCLMRPLGFACLVLTNRSRTPVLSSIAVRFPPWCSRQGAHGGAEPGLHGAQGRAAEVLPEGHSGALVAEKKLDMWGFGWEYTFGILWEFAVRFILYFRRFLGSLEFNGNRCRLVVHGEGMRYHA